MGFWDSLWSMAGDSPVDLGSVATGATNSLPDLVSTQVPTQTESSFFTPGLISSAINAGAGLAGTYFTIGANKENNEAQIQAAKDKLAAELALAGKGGGGGGGSGQGLQIAKMNNLANLYQNWGQLTQRGGEAASQAAISTGKNAIDPIIARLAALR